MIVDPMRRILGPRLGFTEDVDEDEDEVADDDDGDNNDDDDDDDDYADETIYQL